VTEEVETVGDGGVEGGRREKDRRRVGGGGRCDRVRTG
jgi:hypothetical protein